MFFVSCLLDPFHRRRGPRAVKDFSPFLEKEFPHLVDDYRRRYADNAFISKAYSKRLSDLMAGLRKKYGIKREVEDRGTLSANYRAEDLQLALFAQR